MHKLQEAEKTVGGGGGEYARQETVEAYEQKSKIIIILPPLFLPPLTRVLDLL